MLDKPIAPTVLYEELTPSEFSKRLAEFPVAYLPLGALEMHGEHLPLGSDGLQPLELFKRLANETGGIILPMLFMGPDEPDTGKGGIELYGMDRGNILGEPKYRWTPQQLVGSAYWMPDPIFNDMMNAIMKQLSRAGFKIVVAHGHNPSVKYITKHAEEFKEKYNLKVMTCLINDSANLCMQCDHAAANETSIMMYVHPELVHLENLPKDIAIWPLGVGGMDPRQFANREYGKAIIDFQVKKMKAAIEKELLNFK